MADARHFPLVVITWFGEMNEATYRQFHDWMCSVVERAQAEGTKVAMVNDARNARRPPPTVRKYIAELTDSMVGEFEAYSVDNFIVIDNALVRGALTAMQWLSNARWGVRPVPSLAEALERALRLLEAENIPVPPVDPQHYPAHEMPKPEDESA